MYFLCRIFDGFETDPTPEVDRMIGPFESPESAWSYVCCVLPGLSRWSVVEAEPPAVSHTELDRARRAAATYAARNKDGRFDDMNPERIEGLLVCGPTTGDWITANLDPDEDEYPTVSRFFFEGIAISVAHV